MDTFRSDSVFSLIKFTREVKATTMFYHINKTQLVNFFVYGKQSQDCFRIECITSFPNAFYNSLFNNISRDNLNDVVLL